MPHLRLQFLDFSNGAKPSADALAETMIRLLISDGVEDARQNDELLWSVERELYTEGDRTLVPRLRATDDRNDRYNSTRRAVVKHVSPETTRLTVTSANSSYTVEGDTIGSIVKKEDALTLLLSHSILQPLRLSADQSFFISVGSTAGDGKHYLVLSNKLASAVSVSPESVFPLEESSTSSAANTLTSFAGAVIASRLVANANEGSRLVSYETPNFLAGHLLRECHGRGITLLQITSTTNKVVDTTVLNIHPRTSARRVKDLLPKTVSLFVDLSVPGTASNDIGGVISTALNGQCRTMRWTDLFGVNANAEQQIPSPDSIELASRSLSSQNPDHCLDEVSLSGLSQPKVTSGPCHILSWKADVAVPIQVQNVDASYRFREDRTYILFGLSGQLGKSLCTWMVRRGARHVVLTSRAPALDEAWAKDMELLGAVVKFKSK
jgi:hybrid polyketide synthase / nonribosomal peptide synthetase ACE1